MEVEDHGMLSNDFPIENIGMLVQCSTKMPRQESIWFVCATVIYGRVLGLEESSV